MSVIFETLQKLNRGSAELDADGPTDRPRRNVYALKAVLMSPVTIACLALLVFALGYGLVYGLRHLQRSAQMRPEVLAAARTPVAEAATPAAVPTATPLEAARPATEVAQQEVPPPPDVRHLEAAGEPFRSETSESAPATAPATAPDSVDAQVPGAQAGTVAAPSSAAVYTPPGQGVGAYSASAMQNPPPDGWEAGAQRLAPEYHSVALTPSATPSGAEQETAFFQADTAMGESMLVPSAPASRSVASLPRQGPAKGSWGDSVASIAPQTEAAGAAKPGVEMLAADQWMEAAATDDEADAAPAPFRRSPIPRYTRLVRRLQTAVVAGDEPATEQLLDAFAAAKGESHPYLQKIQAYRLLQTGEYGAAEALLAQVLALDEADRDAQMNMAVVEANTGRLAAARRRVAGLAARFPEDETIAAMERQLN